MLPIELLKVIKSNLRENQCLIVILLEYNLIF